MQGRTSTSPSELQLTAATWLDRAAGWGLGGVLLASILCFGGQVSWYPAALAGSVTLVALLIGLRWLMLGSANIVRGPWLLIGFAILALGTLQALVLPAQAVAGLSAQAPGTLARLEVEATGAVRDAPQSEDGPHGPLSISANRSATVRWLIQFITLGVVFVLTSTFARSFRHTQMLLNALILALAVAVAVAGMQLIGDAPGAFGLWTVGQGPAWAPSTTDLLAGPITYVLRPIPTEGVPGPAWLMKRPLTPFAIGPWIAGPGAFLALAALTMPLLCGSILDKLSPKGSVEPIGVRLRARGGVPALALHLMLWIAASGLIGFLGGLPLTAAVGVGVAACCLLASRKTRMTRAALGLGVVFLAASVACSCLGDAAGRPAGASWLAKPGGWGQVRGLWSNAVVVAKSFPIAGVGLGASGDLWPYLKRHDVTSSTAQSAVLQWWAETGCAGVLLVGIGLVWMVCRAPGAWSAIGTNERPMAAGLLGSVLGLLAFSCIHWSIEQPAIALASAAILGCMNRWLSGGTDLFVDDPRFLI